jgi:hypothetical protein
LGSVRGESFKLEGGAAMKKTVPPVAGAPALEEELPVRVQEALGELAVAAREGLLALSVGVGLGFLAELMEEEVVGVVGAKGKQVPCRCRALSLADLLERPAQDW